ncbi:hypothetical protein V8G54_015581 [Vigna mungo]|uniref:60S ribosomal protein L39 n=1 Tax=Vigna mungo TaxID=3915 RepID=A0AAQ3NJK3_VIGMU
MKVAMTDCFALFKEIAPVANRQAYLNVDFLESIHPTQFESDLTDGPKPTSTKRTEAAQSTGPCGDSVKDWNWLGFSLVSREVQRLVFAFDRPQRKWIKKKLAKKMRQNRPIPYWIRMRTDNTIRYNAKRRHWRRTKLGF